MKQDRNNRQLSHDRLAEVFNDLMNQYDLSTRLSVLIDDFLKDMAMEGTLVLDAGCGTGVGTKALLKRGAKVISLDLGFNLARYSREHNLNDTINGNLMRCPFDENTFAFIYSSEVIEHTPDPFICINEIYRILKPGGHAVLSTPGWLWQFPVRLASRLKVRPYDSLENFVKSRQLSSCVENMGGIIIAHKGIHILPFQIKFLHPFLSYMDHYGERLLPLMINQCIHFMKPN